jgi:putative inorganic carbon (hco3(-)) transporter
MTVANGRRSGTPMRARASQRPLTWWQEAVGGVEWTPPFVAFLYYVFVIVTYWLPGADVAMVVALVTLLMRPQDWRIAPALLWFAAFASWAVVAWGSSQYASESWKQLDSLLKVWLVAFVAYNVIRSRAQLRFFLLFATACFVLFPVRGAFFNYFGGHTIWGRALWNFAYGNPNDLAAFCILYGSMALAAFTLCRTKLLRLATASAGGATLVLIFFTQSRGALLAVSAVAMSFVLAKRKNPKVLAGAAAMILLAGLLAPSATWDRLGRLLSSSASTGFRNADPEGSAEQRWQLMQVSAIVAKENPIVGVGPGVYEKVHNSYARRMAGKFPLAGGNRDPHNTITRTAAENGYPGLALFCLMVISTMLRARRSLKRTKIADLSDATRFILLGLTAYMIAGMFGSLAYLNVLYLTLVLLECLIHLPAHSVMAVAKVRTTITRAPHPAILRGS